MKSNQNENDYFNRIASGIKLLFHSGCISIAGIELQLKIVARDQRYASIDEVNAMDIPDDIKDKVTMVIHNSSI